MDVSGQQAPEDKAWFKDGVVFTEFFHPLSLESIQTMQDRGMQLIRENDVEYAPYIIILSGAAQGEVRFSLPDMGKMVVHEFIKHVAGIWMVGRTKTHDQMMDTMNHFFFADHIHFMDSIEEATAGAKQSIANGHNVLEYAQDEE
jgi:hypothetical protein